jgi:hypothetical protein
VGSALKKWSKVLPLHCRCTPQLELIGKLEGVQESGGCLLVTLSDGTGRATACYWPMGNDDSECCMRVLLPSLLSTCGLCSCARRC